MDLIGFPDVIGWFESAATAKMEREVAMAMVSTMLSSYIAGLWRSGDAKLVDWAGEGEALKEMAMCTYLSLRNMQIKGLVLTVPKDMLDANFESKFETITKEK